MAPRRYRLDTRILSLFFLVVMPFVALGTFVVVGMARGALVEQAGQSLEQRAFQTRVAVERYVGDLFVQLRLVADYPEVSAVLAAPAAPLPADEATRLSARWAQGEDTLAAQVVGARGADRLRDVLRVRPGLKLLQVVDASGRLLLSSSRAGRVLNAETAWFRALAAEAEGPAPFMSDVYQASGRAFAVYDLAWPVVDREGRLTGAVRALVDAADVYGVLAPVRIGRTGHALLVRAEDGRVVAGDTTARAQPVVPGFAYLRAALAARRGYWQLPEVEADAVREPARLLGYSPVEQLPGVQWLVVVEQDSDEALWPLRRISRYLWLHFAGAFGTAILLGLYFSMKLERPVIEEAIHLHEEHVPAAARAA